MDRIRLEHLADARSPARRRALAGRRHHAATRSFPASARARVLGDGRDRLRRADQQDTLSDRAAPGRRDRGAAPLARGRRHRAGRRHRRRREAIPSAARSTAPRAVRAHARQHRRGDRAREPERARRLRGIRRPRVGRARARSRAERRRPREHRGCDARRRRSSNARSAARHRQHPRRPRGGARHRQLSRRARGDLERHQAARSRHRQDDAQHGRSARPARAQLARARRRAAQRHLPPARLHRHRDRERRHRAARWRALGRGGAVSVPVERAAHLGQLDRPAAVARYWRRSRSTRSA